MSTLQVANVHLESTGNNRIQYMGSNTINIYAGGQIAATFLANTGPLKFSSNVGNTTGTAFTLTHNLNRVDVFVAVRENSTGYFAYPDIKYVNSNSVIIEFVTAPTTNQYYVSILGV